MTFLGKKLPLLQWRSLQSDFDCWYKNGSWDYVERHIFDNILLYRKCPAPYNYHPHNPCAWILDNKSLKYDWVDICPTLKRTKFEPLNLCKILQGRNIYFLGDSIARLNYMVLKEELLLASNRSCPKDNSPGGFHLHMEFDCSGASDRNFTIRWVSSNHLKLGKSEQHSIIWEDHLGAQDLLILNRGAHYAPDEDLLQELDATMRYVQHTHPGVSVVYRNTVPGVADWKGKTTLAPLKQKPEVARSWHWNEFEHQNEISRQLLETHYPQVLHMDVFSSMVLREDAHYDGLHMCVPGPMSLWVDFLYNALLNIEKQAPASA